jgi:hypothetical protein
MSKFAMMAAVAAAALLAAPAPAHAQWYAGAAYTNFDFDDGEADAITGRLGYRMNQNFAIEGEASTGLNDDDVELNHNAGIYAMGILPVSPSFDLHGRVGFQTSEIDTPLGDFDDDGVGYGVGATWRLGGFGIRGDYTRMEGDDTEADAISIGGSINF